VNKSFSLLFVSGLLSLMAGCASTTYDLPPVTDSDASDADGTVQTYPAGEPAPSMESIDPELSTPAPVPAQPATNPAVVSLTNQARAQYNTRDYQTAIATAERGLRIDRRSPELYLIIAQSYVQLAMPQRAEQFVQQGLRYSQAGSAVADALQRVKDAIATGF
jgi:tetratricopeptide (TPR) repeat protein